ncbi:MAG: hypothetical protein KDD51_16790 [Bdellovibrionales bacterium]|nr:hypothetical protein [Bdellovibrionales bacterium]
MGWCVFALLFLVTIFPRPIIAENTSPERGLYVPGQFLSWNRFRELEDAWYKAYSVDKGVSAPLKEWVQALDLETRPALRRLLSDSETKYFYGSFNPPEVRVKGGNRAVDGGAGFRLIAQLEIGEDNPKLVLALAFLDYDFSRKKLRLIGGPDALRVLTEIGDGNYAGLSYYVRASKSGRVRTITRGMYMDDHGKFIYPGVKECPGPDHCNVCHGKGKRDGEQLLTHPYPTGDEYDDFLDYLRAGGATEGEIKTVKAHLDRPRLLLRRLRVQEAAAGNR